MFLGPHAGWRGRAIDLIAFVLAGVLSACGGNNDAPSFPATQTPSSRLVIDTGTAAPAEGGMLTLKATVLDQNGLEIKGASVAWSSSNESVAVLESASDLPPEAVGSMMQPMGIYATVRLLAAGQADIVATATLPDGSKSTSAIQLAVQPAAAKTYALALSPSTLTVSHGAAPQVVTAVGLRSDGVDGVGDLKDWSWTVDNDAFTVTPASDSHSAQVSTIGTLAAAGRLTTCASTPAGDRLCANAALARPVVPLPSIAFSAPSLNVRPGQTGTVSATLTDAQGVNLANQAALSWSIQQSGTAASIVGAADGASVTVGIDAAQNVAYTATLTVAATYPDGRTNSSSLPLSSPGVWTRLPDSPIANPSIVSVAIDGTRVWRLTADGSHPARLERFGADGAAPREPVEALPASAQAIWLAEATNPTNSSVMVQLAADGATVLFGGLDGELSGARSDVFLKGCSTAATAGRTFVKSSDGSSTASAGWCENSPQWWLQTAGGVAYIISYKPVLDARPLADGSGGLAMYTDGTYGMQTKTGFHEQSPWTLYQYDLMLAAIAVDATSIGGPFYGYVSYHRTVLRRPSSGYPVVWSLEPTLTKLRAIPHHLVGQSASALTLFNTDTRATTTITAPTGGTMADFEAALDARGKVRIAARLADGSVWLYNQP